MADNTYLFEIMLNPDLISIIFGKNFKKITNYLLKLNKFNFQIRIINYENI